MKKLFLLLSLFAATSLASVSNVDKSDLGTAPQYIKNGGFESGKAGWSAYADSSGTAPVDCTGGSPNSALTSSTSSPLTGSASGVWTKNSGASRQGEGFAYNFTIDASQKAQVLTGTFTQALQSGTYATGDQTIYIYDVTNAEIIQPSGYQVVAAVAGYNYKQVFSFQTASNSTSYRVCVHNSSSSNTSAYSFKYDDFVIGATGKSLGVPASDFVAYTPTFTGFGTPTNVAFFSRRIGDSLEVKGSFTSGTTTAVTAKITLGYNGVNANVTTDSAKLSGVLNALVGSWITSYAGAADANAYTVLAPTGSNGYVNMGFFRPSTQAGNTAMLGNDFVSNAINVIMHFTVPITGWSSNVAMSSDTDTRVVSFSGINGSSQSVTTDVTNIAVTTIKDSHGAWNGTQYTVPVPGDYVVNLSSSDSGAGSVGFDVYKNAVMSTRVLYTTTAGRGSGSCLVTNLKAGDVLSVRSGATTTLQTSTRIDIYRLSGPAVVAASEKVYLQYTSNAGTALTANVTNADWSTKVVDSHGAWSGTTFTAPRPGLYLIVGQVNDSSNASAYEAYINTVRKFQLSSTPSANTTFKRISGAVYLNGGDALTIRSDTSTTLSNSAVAHWIAISSQ